MPASHTGLFVCHVTMGHVQRVPLIASGNAEYVSIGDLLCIGV